MNRAAVAAFALAAAAFLSTMAHGQDVPDRLCGYIEFPYRYSESHDLYYRMARQQAKRGRPYVSLDATQAQSIVRAPSADLNGNDQVVVSYGGRVSYTLTPAPCGNETPANNGYVCAATAELVAWTAEYDRHGTLVKEFDSEGVNVLIHEEDIDTSRYWEVENPFDFDAPDVSRASQQCLGYARADHPNIATEAVYLSGGYHMLCYAERFTVEPSSSSGLHNLGNHEFQGTLRGTRIGVSGLHDPDLWGYRPPSITIYETQDNCPTLPATETEQ